MYRPSVKRFLLCLKLIVNGFGVRGKIFLLMIHVLNSLIKIPILKRGHKTLVFVRKLMARKCLIRFGENKFTFVDSFCSLSNHHEPFIWNYLKLKEGDIFIDVGACIGKYTIWGARIVKDVGKVIAIEPEPQNYMILLKNIYLNELKNVLPLNIACWENSGRIKLYISYDSEGHSTKLSTNSYILVDAKPLDDIIREFGLKKVDMVKIDAEGAELEILYGMKNVLANYKPRIIIEVF